MRQARHQGNIDFPVGAGTDVHSVDVRRSGRARIACRADKATSHLKYRETVRLRVFAAHDEKLTLDHLREVGGCLKVVRLDLQRERQVFLRTENLVCLCKLGAYYDRTLVTH